MVHVRDRQHRLLASAAGLIGWSATLACGGADKIAGVTPVASVSVVIGSSSLVVGTTTQATATTRGADGSVLDGRSVTWSSTNTEIASVSSTGEVTALRAGTAEITASSEGITGSAALLVTPPPIHTITVSVADPQLRVGASTQASAITKDENGNVVTDRPIVWTTGNAEVATVSTQGVVTGVNPGTTTITATSEGKSGSASVTVGAPISQIRQRSLSLGGSHTCAISVDGDMYCWGSNYNGQLGNGNKSQHATSPTLVEGGLKFASVSTGGSFTYGLASDGPLYCWGGIPCDPSAPPSIWDEFMGPAVPSPRRVSTNRSLKALGAFSSAWNYTPACALGSDAAYCWGTNRNGELGTGAATQETILVPDPPVAGNHAFADIAAGVGTWTASRGFSGHACAITTTGAGYCWGYSPWGALGDGSSTESASARAVAGNHIFKAIGAGRDFSCGLTTAGEAYCWGSNRNGSSLGTATGGCLGQDTIPCSAIPVRVSGGRVFESFSVGTSVTCGLTSAGDIYCWGPGFGSTPAPFRSLLAGDPGGVAFRTVSVGQGHICAISTTGDMYCRGSNNLGQLGNGARSDGSNTPITEPTLVVGGIKWRTP